MTEVSSNKWYSFVPSMFTTFNLICGVIGVVLALNGKIQFAMLLLFGGALFDFVDGFVARLLKVSGDFGKELDSLADVITFGFLPGAMMFAIQEVFLFDKVSTIGKFNALQWFYYVIPLMIPVFSALRLAKFNIDTRQKESFIGLPTPAAGVFFASLAWILTYRPVGVWHYVNNPLAVSIMIVIFSFLLVSEIPLFSLKFKKFKGKDNSIRFIFLFSSLLILVLLKLEGFPFVVILYIFLSLIKPLLVKIIYKP